MEVEARSHIVSLSIQKVISYGNISAIAHCFTLNPEGNKLWKYKRDRF
jgi:hypothetical protein